MSLTTYDTFFPEVMPLVQNCPEIVAFNAVRNAVIEFCTETWYWQHKCFPQPGETDIAEYYPDMPDNTKLLGVVDAWYDGRNLRPKDEPTLRNIYWNQNPFDVQGDPLFYMQRDLDTVRLIPMPTIPSQFQGLEMLIAVAPMRASTGVGNDIYERYAEAIAHGALARLMAQPHQAYSNPQQAIFMARQFKFEMMQAKAWVQRNKTRGSIMVRFQGTAQ
jgi:hypothetical protein